MRKEKEIRKGRTREDKKGRWIVRDKEWTGRFLEWTGKNTQIHRMDRQEQSGT